MVETILTQAFMMSVLIGGIRLATPILFASLGEVIAERSGILNLGLEGIMVMGAFCAYQVVVDSGNLLYGLAAGLMVGALLGLFMAMMSVTFRVNQIVAGLGIWILGLGLANFVFRAVWFGTARFPRITGFENINIPVLSQIPIIGPILFQHNILVYISILLAPLIAFILFRTTIGLKIRSVGENPKAAEASGVSVHFIRYLTVIIGGLMAGLGGAYMSLAYVKIYQEGLIAGRGWLAIAIVIFSRWSPIGALAGSWFFGIIDALQLRLQATGIPIPYELLLMLPYILTIAILAATAKGIRAGPASLTQPYEKE